MKLIRHRINANQIVNISGGREAGFIKVNSNEHINRGAIMAIPQGVTIAEIRDEFAKLAKQDKAKAEKLFKVPVGGQAKIGKFEMEVTKSERTVNTTYSAAALPVKENEDTPFNWRDEEFMVDWNYCESTEDDEY